MQILDNQTSFMNIIQAEEVLPFTPQTQYILAALANGPLNGYEVIRQAREDAGALLHLSSGSVYPNLKRLSPLGLIEAVEDAMSFGHGRNVRVYRLTGLGQAMLEAEMLRQTDLAELVRVRLAAK